MLVANLFAALIAFAFTVYYFMQYNDYGKKRDGWLTAACAGGCIGNILCILFID